MRVLHSVFHWLPQTETWLYNQVAFAPDDIEAHVVCRSTMHLEQFPWPRLYALDDGSVWARCGDRVARRLGVRRHVRLLEDIAREVRPDVLHSHFGPMGWENAVIASRLGLPHVVTFYGLDVEHLPRVDPRWRARYADLFARAHTILCEGEHMASRIAALGCPESKVRVQHLGVRTDAIPFAPRRWSPGEPLRVLIAASFREKKGIPWGLEALARLRGDVALEVTVIGDANHEARSQEEKRRILAAIRAGGLDDCTRLLGYQPYARLLEEAARHHVFLQPSVTASDGDTEGGAPVALIEMAASGMAIISSRHCDIPGVVVDGVTGLLADERDVGGLERCLRRLLGDPGGWETMLAAARRRVEEEFDCGRQGRRLAAIYAGVAGTVRDQEVAHACCV